MIWSWLMILAIPLLPTLMGNQWLAFLIWRLPPFMVLILLPLWGLGAWSLPTTEPRWIKLPSCATGAELAEMLRILTKGLVTKLMVSLMTISSFTRKWAIT